MPYEFRDSAGLPVGLSALSYGSQDVLSVGSVDGCLRLYRLPGIRVVKAIRGLGDEVSSIRWPLACAEDQGEVWIASGIRAYKFQLNALHAIQPIAAQDASSKFDIGQDADDVLNDLCMSDNKKYLAFSADSGTIGVINTVTNEIARMKAKHDSICSSVKFIPDRPNEIVSGGYDSALLHFDIHQKKLLSRFDLTAPAPTSGVSLSPPFVLSIAVSPSGLLAAGIADGRVWLGAGGDKSAPSSKRSRKWEGLSSSSGSWVQVADGPVVAVSFANENTLLICSLLGCLKAYSLVYDSAKTLNTKLIWDSDVKEVAKVNAIAVNDRWLVVGGLTRDGKGVLEIWDYVPQSEDEE